ncbi:hypothetical protein, partial [Staphylococcus aureus]
NGTLAVDSTNGTKIIIEISTGGIA